MFELKWTDQDMIDFANSCSEYDIDGRQLSDFAEGRRLEAIKERVNKLVGMVAMDEKLLEKLEKVLKEGTK
jgi:hypothetical protein